MSGVGLWRPTVAGGSAVSRIAALVVAAAVAVSITPTNGWAAPGADKTAPAEARLVDRVQARIDWFDCSMIAERAECGTVALPMDYRNPNAATTEVALVRIKAAKPRQRIGTLFLNPGGPGGSGVNFAFDAPYFLDPVLLDRFDVVGFDPRGIHYSDNVKCFRNFAEQQTALEGLAIGFPFQRGEFQPYISSSQALGHACSTTGKPLSTHMSTANVARDMDVLRRILGDRQLNYLGFSYGSYLGQVYANLFPDRVRALVIDGVLDPTAWAGTDKNATTVPQTARLRSAEGADKALGEILKRCEEAGPDYCQLARYGNPSELYKKLADGLRQAPIDIIDPETGEVWYSFTYQDLIITLLNVMYSPDAGDSVSWYLSSLLELQSGDTGSDARATAGALKARLTALNNRVKTSDKNQLAAERAGWAFPYDNSPEAFQTVLCTDSRNPANAEMWRRYANRADRSAPGFGLFWTWASAPCASATWTATDADAYRGPFNRRTANPVLVIGNYWDPATNYDGAVRAAALLPNSRLLSSDSWGHTAYQTSECVTSAVSGYLVRQLPPKPGMVCVGDYQPFTTPIDSNGITARSADHSKLPPVVPPLPGGGPRR